VENSIEKELHVAKTSCTLCLEYRWDNMENIFKLLLLLYFWAVMLLYRNFCIMNLGFFSDKLFWEWLISWYLSTAVFFSLLYFLIMRFCIYFYFNKHNEWMNMGRALNSPCTMTVNDILCIPLCFNPSTILHFQQSVVSYLKEYLDSHLLP
jgi:hypothetical protein